MLSYFGHIEHTQFLLVNSHEPCEVQVEESVSFPFVPLYSLFIVIPFTFGPQPSLESLGAFSGASLKKNHRDSLLDRLPVLLCLQKEGIGKGEEVAVGEAFRALVLRWVLSPGSYTISF